MPKMVNFGEFLKTWENAKIEKLKWDILGDFQTLCDRELWEIRQIDYFGHF